ncbi:hypothetical protein [Rhizobium sp. FY34]|uniref:hypothetical protein n=1 Tax=Rhizobium sp. FY34 TaxID=2562309 RepID=UPI0010C0088A|nr:hypothetical protein [Rhizobium sp. FY34]
MREDQAEDFAIDVFQKSIRTLELAGVPRGAIHVAMLTLIADWGVKAAGDGAELNMAVLDAAIEESLQAAGLTPPDFGRGLNGTE